MNLLVKFELCFYYYQYQALGGQQFSRKTSTMVASPTNTSKIVETTPNQANNTSNLSKVPGTLRHNLTEVYELGLSLSMIRVILLFG